MYSFFFVKVHNSGRTVLRGVDRRPAVGVHSRGSGGRRALRRAAPFGVLREEPHVRRLARRDQERGPRRVAGHHAAGHLWGNPVAGEFSLKILTVIFINEFGKLPKIFRFKDTVFFNLRES